MKLCFNRCYNQLLNRVIKGLVINNTPHIYAVIIGTEILERRRKDKHFDYLSNALSNKGFHLFASYTIKDNPDLITKTFEMIKEDPDAIMFSFGGIGSTPDDLTRQLSANVFSDARLYRHPQFEKDIIARLQERAYPHSIQMADLPKDAGLLFNPVNNMSGFYLNEKFFFMPGFPEMAHPMIDQICERFLPQAEDLFHRGFIAECGEGKLQELMRSLPKDIELSSLPMIHEGKPRVELRLSSLDEHHLKRVFKAFTDFLDSESIVFTPL